MAGGGELDGAVLDFHPYFFGDWVFLCDGTGDVCEQAKVKAQEMSQVPAAGSSTTSARMSYVWLAARGVVGSWGQWLLHTCTEFHRGLR